MPHDSFFLKAELSVRSPLWYHTVSSVKAATEFYSSLYRPKPSSRASYICRKNEWVGAALSPTPLPLLPLPEGGQIKPHSKEGSASPVPLGDLQWPQVQDSFYLNMAAIYRTRSCTPGCTDTEVEMSVRRWGDKGYSGHAETLRPWASGMSMPLPGQTRIPRQDSSPLTSYNHKTRDCEILLEWVRKDYNGRSGDFGQPHNFRAWV